MDIDEFTIKSNLRRIKMATLNDLKKYLDYEFSSGCYTGEDYKSFERKYINYLKFIARENGWELVNLGKNHYEFSAFFKYNDKYVYFSISDVRFWQNDWYNNILIRTAKSSKDYRGGNNYRTTLPTLDYGIKNLFERGCNYENSIYTSHRF